MPRKTKTTTSSPKKKRVLADPSSPDLEELMNSVDKINPLMRPVASHSGSETGFVRETISFDDGSHQYRYDDDIEIISNRFGWPQIIGRFVSVKERNSSIVITYEHESGELFQLDKGDDDKQLNTAIASLWELEKQCLSLLKYKHEDESEGTTIEDKLGHIRSEQRALNARISFLAELDKQHCAGRSLEGLFSIQPDGPAKNIPPRPLKTIALEKATKRIYREHKQKNFRGKRIELCRKLLQQYRIEGRPHYNAEKLNGNVSQLVKKIGH